MAAPARPHPAEGTLETIQDFLRAAELPALGEPGQTLLPLISGQYTLEARAGYVLLHAWGDTVSRALRVVQARRRGAGVLEVGVRTFLGKVDPAHLLDVGHPRAQAARVRHERTIAGERLRNALSRQFPGWDVTVLSTAPDLTHTLSAQYPRALLTRDSVAWAAIYGPPECDAAALLTSGLLWLDHLRTRGEPAAGLALFVPREQVPLTAMRIRHLNASRAQYRLYALDDRGLEYPTDLYDLGNVLRELPPPQESVRRTEASTPEAILEAKLRAGIQSLDPSLTNPVYGQIATLAGVERGIADLLVLDHEGRLHLIELKAGEDPNLPVQALDYWIQVRAHLMRGNFTARGYFPGRQLAPAPPRILLAGPALRFHPANEAVLRYFAPDIPVERIGFSETWREEIRVVLRERLHG
jgi:hypothetical protein